MIQDEYDGLKAYKLYLALKQHFTSDYDFFKYNGAITVKNETFLKRNDKFFFARVQNKYNEKELVELFVANFIESPKAWIRDIASDAGEKIWKDWLKKTAALSYHFQQLIRQINNRDHFNVLFVLKTSHHPELLKMHLRNEVSLEGMIMLDSIAHYSDLWNSKMENDIIWKEKSRLMSKYRPFLSYDPKELRKIALEIL